MQSVNTVLSAATLYASNPPQNPSTMTGWKLTRSKNRSRTATFFSVVLLWTEQQRTKRYLQKYNLCAWFILNSTVVICSSLPWDKPSPPTVVRRLIVVIYNATLFPKLNYSSAKHSNPESLFSLAVTLMCEMADCNAHNSLTDFSSPILQMELTPFPSPKASACIWRPAGNARACLDEWLNLGLIPAARAPRAACKGPAATRRLEPHMVPYKSLPQRDCMCDCVRLLQEH